MNYTYMKGCALCMTLCLTSAALPGRANAESSAIVNEVLQSSVVKGVVKDSNGEPLLGVNVLVKGTTIGAVTDIDGNFSFEAPAGCTLVISYIGFESQEVKVKGNAPLNIILKEDSEALDEVVVVGYGVQKKSDVTGALSSVKGDDLTKLSISRTDQALQGQMAGVMVQNSVAAPGESPNIIIRGGNSLKGENAPLVVIDGVLGGDLSLIDPNDITSIEVLKDASSTSIYGSRGANGVIMVTTKRGQTGKPTVSYSGYVSLSQVSKKMDMLNGQELYGLLKEAQEKYPTTALKIPEWIDPNNLNNTDWQDEIYRVAMGTDHNLSMTGALKNMPYRVSVGYTNQNGTLKNNNYQRLNASIGLSPKFFDKHLSVDINIKGSIEDEKPVSTSVIGSAVGFDPTRPVYQNYDGNVGLGYYMWMGVSNTPITLAASNPVSDLELADKQNKTKRSIGNIALDYKIHGFEDFRLNLNMGYDFLTEDKHDNMPDLAPAMYTGNEQDGTGKRYTYHNDKRNTLLDFYANYAKDFNDHNLNAMAGYGWQRFWYKNHDTTTDTKGEDLTSPKHEEAELYLLSFYGRLNYSWKQRYMLTATLRADASSRFSPETRWGYFPSVAAAWRVNDEAFLADNKVVSDLKLRLSYGQTGQQSIGSYYQHLSTYTASYDESRYLFGNKWYTTYRPNGYDPNIKWETTETYNIGIDYGFLNNRISGTIDYYWRNTKDLLNDIFVPAGSNFTNRIETNIGDMESKGLEIGVNLVPIQTKDWEWNISGNFTWNASKITKLNTIDNESNYVKTGNAGGTGRYLQVHMVGETPNTYYLLKQAYDENGQPLDGKYIVKDGSITSSEEDSNKYVTGKSSKAPYYCGLSTRLSYKNWDLGINGHGSFGFYVYNYVAASNSLDALYGSNGVSSNILRSTLENKFTQDRQFTDHFLERGNFFRIDNITIGHTFNKLWNDGTSLRLSFAVQNVCTLSGYSGLDPELYDGIDKNIYQRPRTFMLGVNLNF